MVEELYKKVGLPLKGFKGMIAWIVAGLPWDAIHAAGNLVTGALIIPLAKLLENIEKRLQTGKEI